MTVESGAFHPIFGRSGTMTESTFATVLMSGGIDSSACAHFLLARGYVVEGLFVDYGQAAVGPESRAVAIIADHLGVSFRRISFAGFAPSGSGELVGRNALLVFAALFANRGRSGLLGLGIHAGTPYYDCSGEFFAAADRLVAEHTDGKVAVVAPFVNWPKRDIRDYFISAKLPVGATYSCEVGSEPSCGKCASCRDRRALGC
jgi:7-cyano-7-deazaguanine synthase